MNDFRVCAIVAVLIAAAAPAESRAEGPHWRADATYSLSGRSSETKEGGFSASFDGFAPSYLRLDGLWFRSSQPPGLLVDLRLEWFRISGSGLGGAQVSTLVVPFSAAVGAAGGWSPVPWLRLDGAVGYGAAGLPATRFSADQTGAVQAALLTYHGPIL